VGAPASFTVTAEGSDLRYGWLRNGTRILGASEATYTISATAPSDDGAKFTAVVANDGGSVLSHYALLTVLSPPVIVKGPVATSVLEGQDATFTVVASGQGTLDYQWRRDGVDIAGATGTEYTLRSAGMVDGGATFAVQVSNGGGSVTSAATPLTVRPRPGWRPIAVLDAGGVERIERLGLLVEPAGTPVLLVAGRSGSGVDERARIELRRVTPGGEEPAAPALDAPASADAWAAACSAAAIAADGGLVLVHRTDGVTFTALRSDGGAWTALGPQAGALLVPAEGPAMPCFPPQIRIGKDGLPVVAYVAFPPKGVDPDGVDLVGLQVMRFDGTSWLGFGGVTEVDQPSSRSTDRFALALDAADQPAVAYEAFAFGQSLSGKLVRFDGTTWSSVDLPVYPKLGSPPPFVLPALLSPAALELDPSGRTLLAGTVQAETGRHAALAATSGAWPGSVTQVGSPSIAQAASGGWPVAMSRVQGGVVLLWAEQPVAGGTYTLRAARTADGVVYADPVTGGGTLPLDVDLADPVFAAAPAPDGTVLVAVLGASAGQPAIQVFHLQP